MAVGTYGARLQHFDPKSTERLAKMADSAINFIDMVRKH
jgi:hypothetical protein